MDLSDIYIGALSDRFQWDKWTSFPVVIVGVGEDDQEEDGLYVQMELTESNMFLSQEGMSVLWQSEGMIPVYLDGLTVKDNNIYFIFNTRK